MEIFKEFTFEAAHRLPRVPEGHRCSRVHGHSYSVAVHVQGHVDEEAGWVIDFDEISQCTKPVIDSLEHTYLNEISGLENPTSERLATWIWERLLPNLPGLSQVVVRETRTSGCVYRGSLTEA